MLHFYPVVPREELPRNHPLHVSQFFNLERVRWSTRKRRQAMIISVAIGWYQLVHNNPCAPGFVEEEVFLTALGQHTGSGTKILELFFTIKRLGFSYGGGDSSPTIVTPRRLSAKYLRAVEELLNQTTYDPGPVPASCTTCSTVKLEPTAHWMLVKLKQENRLDLIPQVKWLLTQPGSISFYYERAGELQARDKSVWPIVGIERWPGWLRAGLFGTVVDLESAYCQFIVNQLQRKYESNLNLLELQYPDLLRADRDKVAFRWELCALLKLEPTDGNISGVKKIVMALANGSNISPALLTNGSAHAEAVRLVRALAPHLLPTELVEVGRRLQAITKQFKRAKKDLCFLLLDQRPTRAAQKKVFREYFAWERESRYAIWEACGRTGLHLHDGLDGIQSDLTTAALTNRIAQETGLRVSVA